MNHHTDTLEWPLTAVVKIARGKYFNENVVKKKFKAVRFTDLRTGRYFYDLYEKDELFLTRVNPLFLDFFG